MEAEETLERVRAHLEETDAGTPLMLTRAFKVEMAIRRGDLAAARRLSRMVDFDVRPPIWFFHVPQLTPIKLLFAEGSEPALSRARERLVEMDDGMRRIHRTNVRIDVLVLLALVCQAQGDEDAALEFLQSAVELADRGPWIRNFVDLGSPMARLLERLVANEPENGFAVRVLAACQAEVDGDSGSREDGATGRSTDEVASRGLLTRRENEILTLLGEGFKNEEIADKLFISIFTVKAHLQNIYGKLDARGRTRALAAARKLRLISDA
jgi:LuxR family maltose regulon positive regulatory protein